jgi:hypothetical protein
MTGTAKGAGHHSGRSRSYSITWSTRGIIESGILIPESLGGFAIDGHFELGRLLDRQLGECCDLETHV